MTNTISVPMTSRERLLTALQGKTPDHLPATTHHLMPNFLQNYMGGCSEPKFFEHFGLDAINWFFGTLPNPQDGAYLNTEGSTQTDNWFVTSEFLPNMQYQASRYTITTPGWILSMVLASDQYTTWIAENPSKNKSDIDVLGMDLTCAGVTPIELDNLNRYTGNSQTGLIRRCSEYEQATFHDLTLQ